MQIFVGIILGLGARVPQILLNHQNGHTVNLALATYIFNTIANVICCTSTAMITGDVYVMTKELWMLSLNATIVTQICLSQAKQRAAAAAEALRGIATSPMRSGKFQDSFGGGFRSRSRTVHFLGLPATAGGDSVEPDQRQEHGKTQTRRRGGVIRPGSWDLDSSSPSQRAGVNPYSLDADKLGSDDYDRLKRGNSGSMDGMRSSLA